jgi:hypothetical protein
VAGRSLQLGSESPTLFVATSFAYVAAVLALGFPTAPACSACAAW